jgi:predicted GTPase
VAAQRYGAASLVDPRPYLVGRLQETFATYPDIGTLLPAMGYGPEQLADLEATIAATPADAVVIGTPIDLARVIRIAKPHTRVFYDLEEIGTPNLEGILGEFLARRGLA